MLTNTFCHIPGIAEKTEQRLWDSGVVSWDTALQQMPARLNSRLQKSWHNQINKSIDNYNNRNAKYFYRQLEPKQHWRLYREFQDNCAFIDIETTGLYYPSKITTITLYDTRSIRYYVNGQNLEDFVRDVQGYSLLVTYNGKQFDFPFIKQHFSINLSQAHIDLRFLLADIGLKGGLKRCEKQLGFTRPGMELIDGEIAVHLWNMYSNQKNKKALETLLAYNIQDTVVLHKLMVHAYNEKVKLLATFSDSHILPEAETPHIPFKPDQQILEQISNQTSQNEFGFPNNSGIRFALNLGRHALEQLTRQIIGTTDDPYWKTASRKVGKYPEHTERGGKWLIFESIESIDNVWATIKIAVEKGLLGNEAKCATNRPNPNARDPNTKVICVYTYDGNDEEDVWNMRETLRELGIKENIPWKSDEATYNDLYSVKGDRKICRYRG